MDNNNSLQYYKKHTQGAKVWFAFRECSKKEIKVINITFYFGESDCSYETYGGLTTVVGQFLSSKWFSGKFDIQRSYEFYVFSCHKDISYKKVCDEIKLITDPDNSEILQNNKCENTIFNFMNVFLLKSEFLCNLFDDLILNNDRSRRITIIGKNSIHTLELYVTTKHLNPENDDIEENVIIETPVINYYMY